MDRAGGMMKNNAAKPVLDVRQQRSRAALNAALLDLLKEKAFDRISIREIAARAGIGYATFFRHYPGKEALLSDVASAEIANLFDKSIPALFSAGVQDSTLVLCNFVHGNRGLWSALLTGGAAATMRAEFVRQAREWAARTPPMETWLPRDLSVVYGAGATIDLLAWWLEYGADMTAADAAAILDKLIIAPIVGDLTPVRSH